MTTSPTPVTILVVDDDPAIARLLGRELRRNGHHTETASSATEAMEWLRKNRADLLLLDLKLPDAEGPELINRLASEGRNVPFVIITGQGDERVAVAMMKRGALDYLVKDANFIKTVPTVVQRALARLEEQAKLYAAEEALRLSQQQYHTLFSTLLEGFGIIEVIFDARDHPIDFRFLEVNPAFELQTGLCNAQGRLMRELSPDIEAHWFEIYGRVALTGEPARFVNEAKALQRWFDVSAFRLGGPDSRKVVILFNDITQAKRAKDALARSHAELERRVTDRTEELTQSNKALRDSRMAALNLMEDAIAAREKTEQAQAALRESEARFRGFFENVGVGSVELNADGRFTRVNDRFCSITGYSREELLGGMTPIDLAHPDVVESYRAQVEKLLRGEVPIYHEELRFIRKDGSGIWMNGTATTLFNDDGTVKCLVSIAEDVTDRKQAEQALLASEERLRLFIKHTPAPVVMFDREMRYLVVSDRLATDFRLDVGDLTGRSHYEVFPEIPDHWKQIHQRCLAGATESCERDNFPRTDGLLDWVKWECRPWYDAKGEIGGIILFVEVINDRVRSEDEILKARRFAESTLEAIPASIVVLDVKGKILSTNQAWKLFAESNGGPDNTCGFGTNYLDVCDAAAGDGVEEAARFAEGIREVMRGEIPSFNMEYACHSPDQQRWFVGYVTPFMGNGPHSVVIAHVDVSERKRAEQVIRRLNSELEMRVEQRTAELRATNKALRHQIAMRRQLEEEILHISEREQQRIGQDLHDDLGQQLVGIWCLSMAQESNLAEEKSTVLASARKISGLLKNALALTRSLASGLHPVAVQSGGLNAALEELTKRTFDMFRVNCRCKCPPSIDLDNTTATHLYRIAQEAVTNAIKHGKAKEIDIELSTNPHHTVLSVSDQGKGIAHLDPKHRGMGLRIMSYRADMIGGELKIASNPDTGGTVVTCSIPTPSKTPTDLSNGSKKIPPSAQRPTKKSLHRR